MTPTRFVNSQGIALAVYEWSAPAPDKPTLILVHGYPDSALVWDAVARLLAPRYHVCAYDVRGAGRSGVPRAVRDFALEVLVEDLAAVADEVSPDRPVHLAGHDWGSIQTWEAVTTERMAGRIASFTSISGPSIDHAAHWLADAAKSGTGRALVRRQLRRSWYIGAFQLPLLGPGLWKAGLDRAWPSLLKATEKLQTEASPTQRKDGSVGVNLYRANFGPRMARPRERRTDLPVQLIVALRDRFIERALFDSIPRWAPNLWRREIDAGHWVPLSHPSRVAAMISEFVDSLEGGPPTRALEQARIDAKAGGADRRPWSGRTVVVTGAGSGIGRETLLLFAERGATVVAADIDLAAAERSAELARLLDAEAWAQRVDVGSVAQMETFAAWVADTLGAPDVVVNNAGIGLSGAFLDTGVEDWEKLLRVNLWGVILGSKLFGRQMLEAGKRGHIVNVASAAAFSPSRLLPAYATTKAAVLMLSDCLRAELADRRIEVVSVCPGFVDTPITTSTRFVGVTEDEQARRRNRAAKIYGRRSLKPAAVARAILDAVEGGHPEALVGAEAHAFRFISRFAPALQRRLAKLDLG